jgi:NADH-quinone oxidoreductase subunit G
MTNRAAFPPGEAREDWAILRALSATLGKTLPFDSLGGLRSALYAAHPNMAMLDMADAADPSDIAKLSTIGGKPEKAPFSQAISDFYMTNPVARASAVLAECSALAAGRLAEAAE